MIIKISRTELLEYMREAIENLENLKITPIVATVEDREEENVWTFKLTYKVEE